MPVHRNSKPPAEGQYEHSRINRLEFSSYTLKASVSLLDGGIYYELETPDGKEFEAGSSDGFALDGHEGSEEFIGAILAALPRSELDKLLEGVRPKGSQKGNP